MRVGALHASFRVKKPWTRAPQGNRPFRFVELLPLQLKNAVSSKSEKTGGAICIEQMAVMFACMKDNEFKEALCSKEITTFQECYSTEMAKLDEIKKQDKLGLDSPGSTELTHKQLTRLLQKYPQVNEPRHKPFMKK